MMSKSDTPMPLVCKTYFNQWLQNKYNNNIYKLTIKVGLILFDSLKKKFSRTSEKLEEELIEEAKQEDNIEEETGGRFSFFSFGSKKEDEDNLLPEADEETPEVEETLEEEEDSSEEEEKEKKSRFWSRNKGDDEETPEDEEKSHFWTRKPKESADGEATGGMFSFAREKTIKEKHVEDILFELEMELLQGDVAMEVATDVVESVRESLVGKKIKRSNDITEYTYYALRDAVKEIIDIPGKSMTEMLEEKVAQG